MLEVAVLRIGIPWTFSFPFAYVRAQKCPKIFRRSIGSNTKEEPYAAQIFRIIRTPILSAINIRRNTYAAIFRNVGTLPHSSSIAVRTGLVMTKIVRICPSVFVCHT